MLISIPKAGIYIWLSEHYFLCFYIIYSRIMFWETQVLPTLRLAQGLQQHNINIESFYCECALPALALRKSAFIVYMANFGMQYLSFPTRVTVLWLLPKTIHLAYLGVHTRHWKRIQNPDLTLATFETRCKYLVKWGHRSVERVHRNICCT